NPTQILSFFCLFIDGSNGSLILLQIFALSSFGFLAAATAIHLRRRLNRTMRDKKPVPRLVLTKSGRVDKLEDFSSYVARQLGFAGVNECPQLGKLAYDYLRKVKGHEENIYSFFANDRDADALYTKLLDELDRCILGYFAYHWSHASLVITRILDAGSHKQKKLRDIVMAATRKQRFEKVTKDLKVKRLFSTLVEEMKAIGKSSHDESECTEVMVPAALSERSPMLLLMGGGMGAGKSTVLKDILKDPFWSDAAANAVIVEADAFKETDVIYRALSSRGEHHDMLQTAELVHQSSTDAASSLLVTALNEGRDVILDSTLSWEPFVEQTIAMARNVHRQRYRMGIGYKVCEDGTFVENYWERVEESPEEEEEERVKNKRKPYRIELVGVVCDAYLAVVRGIRRAILMGRAVRVKSQLKSHKSFAMAFPDYCLLVDNARLFCTNSMGGPPKKIGRKDGSNQLLVDPDEIECLKRVSLLNEEACSVEELYGQDDPMNRSGSIWFDVVLASSRAAIQGKLKLAIQRTENQLLSPQSQNLISTPS
ncbi:calmodulin calcium-dependent NAD kinase-like, partial [Aristolochia californica]|uniref:calmodulin calcium-dependent NAD kinase-like n=1 Tax=Aristolochia californica TaxID=171875 RepID=UPI0035D55936